MRYGERFRATSPSLNHPDPFSQSPDLSLSKRRFGYAGFDSDEFEDVS